MKPYISQRTRDAAMRAVEDLPTEALLDAIRQAPVSTYRRKELDEALDADLREHRKTFPQEQERPRREAEPVDPARLVAAMSYAGAPKGPSGGEVAALRVRPEQRAPEQGNPLGPMRVKQPEIEDGGMRVYDALKFGGGAGGGDEGTMENGEGA